MSAWGVNVIEGPNKALILCLLGIALSLSLVVAVFWSVYKNDMSGGMAVGTYLVAVVAIVATFLSAKWHGL